MNIKKIIREELDNLNWIHDIVPNKWEVFESVIKENPNIQIKKGNNGEWLDFVDEVNRPYFGAGELEDTYGLDLDIKKNDMSVIIYTLTDLIDTSFTQRQIKENDTNYLDFMELKRILESIDNLQMNESDDKDLKWIEDTEPDDYSFKYLDKVMVHNIGNEASFLKWLGQERNQKNYKNGVYGVNITGTIWDVYTDDFSIMEKNTGDVIYFPNNKMMSVVQDIYPGLSIYYELIPE